MITIQDEIDKIINAFFNGLNLRGEYQHKSLYNRLVSNDFEPAYGDLFDSLFRKLEDKFSELARFKRSESRGRLRSFCPIGQKAVDRLIGSGKNPGGKGFEVPLERSLALVNNICCQFAPAVGWDTHTFKRIAPKLIS